MESNLKCLRLASGLSLQGLADIVGLSKPYLWKIETEGGNPSIDVAYKLAVVFQKSVYEVFPNPYVGAFQGIKVNSVICEKK